VAEGVHRPLEQLPALEHPGFDRLLGVIKRQKHVGRHREPKVTLLLRLIDALHPSMSVYKHE
jgi:hypothetical protein